MEFQKKLKIKPGVSSLIWSGVSVLFGAGSWPTYVWSIPLPDSEAGRLIAVALDIGEIIDKSRTLTLRGQPILLSGETQVALKRREIVRTLVEQRSLADLSPETRLKQGDRESVPEQSEIKLLLSDVVSLVLENSRTLKNVYLERIAQREDLAVAEDKFVPDFTPVFSYTAARATDSDQDTETNGDFDLTGNFLMRIPTGAEVGLELTSNLPTTFGGSDSDNDSDSIFRQDLELTFNQPLLRGAGIAVNTASIKIARLTEQGNILTLKSTLIDTITSAILAYRQLLQAQEALNIAQLSLQSAQELLEFNRVLIEFDRLAPVEITQSETAVANREVDLIAAENALEASKLALIEILDIDQSLAIVAADPLTIAPVALDTETLRQLAFENRPDYLRAQLNLENTQLELLLASNNRLWDLSLNTNYRLSFSDINDMEESELQAGLSLTYEFGDRTRRRDFRRSQVSLSQAENDLAEERERLEIQLTDRLREIELSLAQVELAREATELSERQLEIEREKQRLGRGTTLFEILRLQDDLALARTQELTAKIDYLNALTRLDQTLGTTLETWQIPLESE